MSECLVGRGEHVVDTKVITSRDPPRKGHAEAMSSKSLFQVMPCRMGWDAMSSMGFMLIHFLIPCYFVYNFPATSMEKLPWPNGRTCPAS